MEVAERELVAGPGDVDLVAGERAVELGALQLGSTLVELFFEPPAQGVEGHAALAVAYRSQRLREVALAA